MPVPGRRANAGPDAKPKRESDGVAVDVAHGKSFGEPNFKPTWKLQAFLHLPFTALMLFKAFGKD